MTNQFIKTAPVVGRRQFMRDLDVGVASLFAGHALLTQTGCSTATERKAMPTRTEMKNALKDRISTDDPGNYNNNLNNWDQVRLGIYYDEDKELVEIAIYETTSQAVG